jgi:hypothetical protein
LSTCQKQRLELGIERLRSLLELADRAAQLKGEDQEPLLLLADRGLRQGVGGVRGLLLHLLHRPRRQQAGDQRTQVFPARLGPLSGAGQQLGEVVELTVVDEERGPQEPPGLLIGIEHPLHQILDPADQLQPQPNIRIERRQIGVQLDRVALDRRQLFLADPAVAQFRQKGAQLGRLAGQLGEEVVAPLLGGGGGERRGRGDDALDRARHLDRGQDRVDAAID